MSGEERGEARNEPARHAPRKTLSNTHVSACNGRIWAANLPFTIDIYPDLPVKGNFTLV